MESHLSKNKQIDYLSQGILNNLPTIEEKISCLRNFNTNLTDDAFLFFIQHENIELRTTVIECYSNPLPKDYKDNAFSQRDYPIIQAIIARGEAFNDLERDFIKEAIKDGRFERKTQNLFIQNTQTAFDRPYILEILNSKQETECCSLIFNHSIHLEQCDFESLFQHFKPQQPATQQSSRVIQAILLHKDFLLQPHHIRSIDYEYSMPVQKALVNRNDYLPSIAKIEAILSGKPTKYINHFGQTEIFDGTKLTSIHPEGPKLLEIYANKKPLWEKQHLANNLSLPSLEQTIKAAL